MPLAPAASGVTVLRPLAQAHAVLRLSMDHVCPVSSCNGSKTTGLKMGMFSPSLEDCILNWNLREIAPAGWLKKVRPHLRLKSHLCASQIFVFTGVLQLIPVWTELCCSEDTVLYSHICVSVQGQGNSLSTSIARSVPCMETRRRVGLSSVVVL